MPREYQIKPGTASPSPMQFGSADINLQTPRFVAQTNVAPKENPFEALSKILSGISTVVKQSTELESEKIRGQISYSNAVRQEEDRKRADAERVRIEQERESTKKAFELKTKFEQRTIKSETPEEAAKIAEEIRKLEESDPKQAAALVEAYRSARSQESYLTTKADKKALDAKTATQASFLSRAASAEADGNLPALSGLYKDAVQQASDSTDPEMKLMLTGVANAISASIARSESKQETVANKEELKLRQAAYKATEQAIDRVKPQFFGNDMLKFMSQFDDYSGTALSDAVFERLSVQVEGSNENIQELLKGATDVEIEAFNDSLKKATDGIVTKIMDYRQQRHDREAFESYIAMASLFAGQDLDGTVEAVTTDSTLSPAQRDHVLKRVAYDYIDRQPTNIDRLNVAQELLSKDPTMSVVASGKISKIIKDIQGEVEAVHDGLFVANLPADMVDDSASGWLLQFGTKDELVSWVLESKFGTTKSAYDSDVEIQRLTNPVVTKVATQWDQEQERFESRQTAERRAAERAAKKKEMTPTQAWKTSPLAQYMDGQMQGIPYGTLKPDEIYPLLMDALTGHATDGIPTQLMEAVTKNIGDERNYPLVQAFWKVMSTSNDATLRYAINSDGPTFESFALGQFLNWAAKSEMTPYTVNTKAKEFIANIQAYRAPSSQTEKFRNEQRIRNESLASLAIGAGIDTGWVTDYSGIEPNQIIKTMSLADQETFLQFSSIAAAANEQPATFLADMLKSNGFRVYPYTTEKGETVFKIANPYLVQPGYTTHGLPEPNELEENGWTYYLNSKKDDVARALNKRPQLGAPYTYTASDIEAIAIAPTSSDLMIGRCAIKAKIAGEWKTLDAVSEAYVTAEEYGSFKKEQPLIVDQPVKSKFWAPNVGM